MVPDLLILALDYYRAPLSYPHLSSPDQPLPAHFDKLIGDFAGALSPKSIETTAQKLGTSSDTVKGASLFFLRQVLMAPGSDHYRVLGLSPDASEETIRSHYKLLVRIFHPDRSDGDTERDAEYTARINGAYKVLRNPETRQGYDRVLASARSGRRAAASDVDGFRPRQPFAPTPVASISTMRLRPLGRWPVPFLAGGLLAVAGVVAIVLWKSSAPPVLRVNPNLADASIAEPSFLRKPASSRAPSGPAQRPELPAETSGSELKGETREQAPLSPAAGLSVGLSASSGGVERLADGMSRDDLRNAAMMGSPVLPVLADDDSVREPTGAADDVSRSVEDPANPPKPQISAGAQEVEPLLAQSPGDDSAAAGPTAGAVKPEGRGNGDAAGVAVQKRHEISKAKPKTAPREKPAAPAAERDTLDRREPPQIAKVPRQRQTAPDEMVARLTRRYRAGDLQGFLNLFTASARTRSGSGKSAIRSDYAGLFARTSDRRLSIKGLSWRRSGNGGLVGTGTYRAGTKARQGASWRYETGKLHIELVPWRDGYKISKFVH